MCCLKFVLNHKTLSCIFTTLPHEAGGIWLTGRQRYRELPLALQIGPLLPKKDGPNQGSQEGQMCAGMASNKNKLS